MHYLRKALPSDSHLHDWLDYMSLGEVPTSYQLAVGLSTMAALLRRNCWVPQHTFNVYPMLPVLLVGPSGIGKDTAINPAKRVLAHVGTVPDVSGRTIELTLDKMLHLPPPASCHICAGELAAYLGEKDYQSSYKTLTDIMSHGDAYSASLKSTGTQTIVAQSMTMMTGSTAEWLQRNLPDGAVEGGFLPRFLVFTEKYGYKHVPLVLDIPREKRLAADRAGARWTEWCKKMADDWADRPEAFGWATEAKLLYQPWYHLRMADFDANVKEFANRSRDMVLRLGMLSAISADRRWFEKVDIAFAIRMIRHVAAGLRDSVVVASAEGRAVNDVLRLLPATEATVYRLLGAKHTKQRLENALQILLRSKQVEKRGQRLVNVDE